MKLFVDSTDVNEIKEAVSWGVVDGVTTNPRWVYRGGGGGVTPPVGLWQRVRPSKSGDLHGLIEVKGRRGAVKVCSKCTCTQMTCVYPHTQ
jgi:hypothetical protein